MKTQVIDDFVDSDYFEKIQEHFLGGTIPWTFQNGVVLPNDGGYQFIHLMYTEYAPRTPYFDLVEPIVDHFSPFLVWRRIVTPALTGSIVPFIENFAPSETSAGG